MFEKEQAKGEDVLIDFNVPTNSVVFDMDDTLADFTTHWRSWMAKEFPQLDQKKLPLYGYEKHVRENFGPEGDAIIKKFYETHQMAELGAVQNVISVVGLLAHASFDFHIITSRPGHIPECRQDTLEWLAIHCIPVSTLTFTKNKTQALQKINDLDYWPTIFFEDSASAITEYHQEVSKTSFERKPMFFLRKRDHNEKVEVPSDVTRFSDYYKVYQKLLKELV